MAPTAQTPGAHNVFIPNTDATNNMVVDFSRNINDFALPRYAQYIPVQKVDGRYIRMTIEVAGRLINSNMRDFAWADGTEAPQGYGNRELFEYQAYRTSRFAYPVPFGELTVDQAEWDVLAQHSRIMAQLAMTARTQSAQTALDTLTQTATASSTGTGKHDVSTTARKDIKRSLDNAADTIQKATLSAVKPGDLHVVVGSDWARKIAVSQEIVDHIKQSPAAREELEKGLGPNNRFGLPSTLYGYPIEVETTVKVTSRKGAAALASSYIYDGQTCYMVSRPGGLEGVEGAPSFSTLTAFLKEEMTVESKHDRDNRMHKTRVVDDYQVVVTAPIAGFKITDCLT